MEFLGSFFHLPRENMFYVNRMYIQNIGLKKG